MQSSLSITPPEQSKGDWKDLAMDREVARNVISGFLIGLLPCYDVERAALSKGRY